MWRWLVIVVLLIGVALGGAWLQRVIAEFGVIAIEGDHYRVVASGWAAVWQAWPIALAGVLLGMLVGVPIAHFLLDAARTADYEHDLSKMTLQVQQAEAKAAQARQDAERELERERQEARRLAQQSRDLMEATEAERAELEAWRISVSQQVNQQLALASQEVSEAHRVIADAELRRRNASAVAERRRRKLAQRGNT